MTAESESLSVSVNKVLRLLTKNLSENKIPWLMTEVFGIQEGLWLHSMVVEGVRRNGPIQSKQDLVEAFRLEWGGRPGLTYQDAEALVEQVVARGREILMERERVRVALKLAKQQKRTEMRVRYQNTPVFRFYNRYGMEEREDWEAGYNWQFKREVRGMGLLDCVLAEQGKEGISTVPMRRDQTIPGDGYEPIRDRVWEVQLDNLWKKGWAVSQDKLLLNRSSEGWKVGALMFPDAVNFQAYIHGLQAPTVPGGVMLNCKVRFCTIKQDNGMPAKTDGSGRIHPLHPLYQQLARPTMYFPIQIRFFNEQNTFAKGILVPDERCVSEQGEPEIWLDWLQVKGQQKEAAAQYAKQDKALYSTGHLGVIQVWDDKSSIDWSFEQLENIHRTPRTEELIRNRVSKAMNELQKKGMMGLAEKVARDDQSAMMALKLVAAMKRLGKDVNPLSIPLIQAQLKDRLGKHLWWIAQGAGIQMDRYVPVLDAGVEKGTCVVKGFRLGTKLATMRYPVVLTQGLSILEVVEAAPRHLVNGEVIPWVVYMNPSDLTGRLMGDDDGDTVGLSSDQDLVELFMNLIDDKVYAIEPEGKKFTKHINSKEGLEYLAVPHKDDVGKLTIMRTKLLAVGDIRGAVAISCLIQEAIDRAKRIVEWTDWREAAKITSWEQDQNGTLHYKGPRLTGDLPIQDIARWVNKRIARQMNLDNMEGVSCISWRTQFTKQGSNRASKRVDPTTWQTTKEAGGWNGGNLVHVAFNHALQEWQAIHTAFMGNNQTTGLDGLLCEALQMVTSLEPYQTMDWDTYEQYRGNWGITNLLNRIRQAMQAMDEEDRYLEIDRVIEEHQEEMKEMVAAVGESEWLRRMELIWRMECRYARTLTDGDGNINTAFYSLAWDGSPILTSLGIESPSGKCNFLTVQRIKRIIGICVESPDPIQRLTEVIQNSTLHAQECKDEEGEPIPAWQCQDCQDALQTHLVRRIRRDKGNKVHQEAKRLVQMLKSQTVQRQF